jgi:imidazoleglycerol-phosphate dehydratase
MNDETRLSAPLARTAARHRVTRETDVAVTLDLDTPPETGTPTIATSVPFLDHLLSACARHGRFRVSITASGDTEVDDHHTVEDVGIVLGQALREALGERRGIARFGSAYVPMDEALARAIVDISGRPYLVYETSPVALPERVGRFDTQLVEEFWRAFATEARVTLHLDLLRGRNGHHACEALFKAVGLALRMAVRVETPGGAVPSTKEVLE